MTPTNQKLLLKKFPNTEKKNGNQLSKSRKAVTTQMVKFGRLVWMVLCLMSAIRETSAQQQKSGKIELSWRKDPMRIVISNMRRNFMDQKKYLRHWIKIKAPQKTE